MSLPIRPEMAAERFLHARRPSPRPGDAVPARGDMGVSEDGVEPALTRRRRTTERTGQVARIVGLAIVAMIGFTQPPGAPVFVHPDRTFVVITLCAFLLGNGVSLLSMRHLDQERYRRFNIGQVVLDTVAMVSLTAFMSALPQAATWPLMLLPILIAAVRLELLGTLLTWAVTSASYVVLYGVTPHIYGHPMQLDTVLAGVGLGLVVAVMGGMQSRAMARHLTDLHVVRTQLRHQALHDPLTGLGNRTMLYERAARSLDPARAGPVAVLNLDLNGFKQINDTLGHAAGDALLAIIAARLRTCIRASDVAIRLGGDEFVVLLDGSDARRAGQVAERIRASVADPVEVSGHTVRVGVSIGMAVTAATDTAADGGPQSTGAQSARTDRLDGLLRRADAEMYADKTRRRADTMDQVPPVSSRRGRAEQPSPRGG